MMWNSVELVAKHNNVEPAALVDFAISRDAQYGIVVERGTALISNWNVEELVKDFEEFKETTMPFTTEQLAQFKQIADGELSSGDLSDADFQVIFDHFVNNGEMPYGVAKARDGDPFSWIDDHIDSVLQ